MYQHAIDNFKLIAEINVLASETFKTKLCWERSKKKCYESKSTVLPQNLSTIVAIVAMFLFAIMITLTCTCTFAWGDDYSYPVVSYKFLKDEISFRGSEISSRRNDISHRFAATKFRFVEAKLRSNDIKFRLTGTKFRNEISLHAAKFRFD